MRVNSVRLVGFKRFTDLTIQGLPDSARLVMLTGPNGSGKSAIFEGFNHWRRVNGGWGPTNDPLYFPKMTGAPVVVRRARGGVDYQVHVEFHGPPPADQNANRRSFSIRSAYRHDADFTTQGIHRQPLRAL